MPAELYVHDGSVWRRSAQVYIHDGSVWRDCIEVYIHDGSVWRQSFVKSPAVTGTAPHAEDLGANWRGRVEFSVNGLTQSVVVEVSENGGAFAAFETLNVTPGSSGNFTSWRTTPDGATLDMRLRPWTGSGGSGASGTPVTQNIPEV